jgi:hypothetical protein
MYASDGQLELGSWRPDAGRGSGMLGAPATAPASSAMRACSCNVPRPRNWLSGTCRAASVRYVRPMTWWLRREPVNGTVCPSGVSTAIPPYPPLDAHHRPWRPPHPRKSACWPPTARRRSRLAVSAPRTRPWPVLASHQQRRARARRLRPCDVMLHSRKRVPRDARGARHATRVADGRGDTTRGADGAAGAKF